MRFLILFLISSSVFADQGGVYSKLGVGTFNSAKDSTAEVKTVAIGIDTVSPFSKSLRVQHEVQGWLDSRGDIGRKSGGMLSSSLGVVVNPGYFYVSTYVGIGLKLPNDSYLGGPIQFVESVSIGVRDERGSHFGLFYQHISSAGIFRPNVGRDFIGVRTGISF